MIKAEGIMAFHGTATIRPKNLVFEAYDLSGDWVYKQDTGCWYCKGSSYMKDIVTDIREEMQAADLIGELEARINALKVIAVTNENVEEIVEMIDNVEKWLDSVKKGVK